MSILIQKDSKVLIQGFTGDEATFHSQQMIEYGTNVVGGVTPGKGDSLHLERPVFNTVSDAVHQTEANVSVIFVPPAFAADAIMEAADAEIALVICITEGIPVQDMIKVKSYLSTRNTRLIGPNCPGIIAPGEIKVGIMPGEIHKKGSVGIISRSGTLSYEAVDQLTQLGVGQSICIGVGGDAILGTTILDAVKLLNDDSETKEILIIGEIGGTMEIEAAQWIKDNTTKPVIGFIAGHTAPNGRTMGHAGAIIGDNIETAEQKNKVLAECGITVVSSPAEIGETVLKRIKNQIK